MHSPVGCRAVGYIAVVPQAGMICRLIRWIAKDEEVENLVVPAATHCERVSGCFEREKDFK
jgi:hypothetical protein